MPRKKRQTPAAPAEPRVAPVLLPPEGPRNREALVAALADLVLIALKNTPPATAEGGAPADDTITKRA